MGAELHYLNSGTRSYATAPVGLNARLYWEFQAVIAGRIAPVMERETGRLYPRRLWIAEAGHRHGWTGVPGETAEILVYHLSPPEGVLQDLVRANGGLISVSLTETDMEHLQKRHEEIVREWVRPTDRTPLKVTQLLTELSLLVLERSGYVPRVPACDRDTERVNRAEYWYRQNLHQHPGVSEVARAVGISEVHLRRLFKKVRGQSPKAVFQRIRLESLRESLRNPDETVEALAARYGFADASSLTRAYRRHFHATPRGRGGRGQR